MDIIKVRELEELLNHQLSCNGSLVRITEISDKKVVVQLKGTCQGCPGAQITVADTLETVIKEQIPTIQEVILDDSCDEEMILFAKQLLNHDRLRSL